MSHAGTLAPAAPARARSRFMLAAAGTLATTLTVCLAAAAAAPALAAPAARSGHRAFFGLGPASKTTIDGRTYFDWSATPGSHLTDHVAIVNFGVTAVTLRVFVTNAVSTARGGTGFLPKGKAKGGPAAWVKVRFPGGTPTVRLAPRSKVILPVTVVIPKNAPPGDHVGAIVAALNSVIQSKRAKVHFVQQVADRIIARISGKLRPQLSVQGLRVTYRNPVDPVATGPATVTFTVRNTGNELLGGNVTVSLGGLLGSIASRPDVVKVPIMLPGGSDRATVRIAGVYPEFAMNAAVTVTPLVVTGQYDPGLTNYHAQVGFWSVPWVDLAIAAALAGLAVAFWLRRRRRSGALAVSGGRARRGVTEVEAS